MIKQNVILKIYKKFLIKNYSQLNLLRNLLSLETIKNYVSLFKLQKFPIIEKK